MRRANCRPERSAVARVKCRPALGSTTPKTFAVPQRRYSLSRFAGEPGFAGIGDRSSACSDTGFSSKQTTGSEASWGFSYTASTSSILRMYCRSNCATHHIFFPPRLQVVVFQQYSNCLPTHPRNELTSDSLLGHQPYRPASIPLRGLTAHHGNDALLLGCIQNLAGPRSLLVVQSPIQPAPIVAVGQLTDGLCGQGNTLRNLRRSNTPRQLPQSKGAQNHAYLLNPTSKQGPNFSQIRSLQVYRNRWTCHKSRVAQDTHVKKRFKVLFQAVGVLGRGAAEISLSRVSAVRRLRQLGGYGEAGSAPGLRALPIPPDFPPIDNGFFSLIVMPSVPAKMTWCRSEKPVDLGAPDPVDRRTGPAARTRAPRPSSPATSSTARSPGYRNRPARKYPRAGSCSSAIGRARRGRTGTG